MAGWLEAQPPVAGANPPGEIQRVGALRRVESGVFGGLNLAFFVDRGG